MNFIPTMVGLRRVFGLVFVSLVVSFSSMTAAQGPGAADGPEEPKPPTPTVLDTGITVSVSRQFRVLGANSQVRRLFSSQAEDIAADYHKLLGRQGGGSLPITIQLHDASKVSPVNPSVVQSLQSVGGTFRLLVHVRLDDGATPEAFQSAILRCLLAIDIIQGRTVDEIPEGRNLVPAWLERGVAASIDFRREGNRSVVASAVFARGRAFPVEKILRESPDNLPAAGRAAYDASACGLVLTLLGFENGPARFLRLLADFAAIEADPAAQIRHHFQEMAESDRALEKWWALQLAQMARPGATDFMDPGESDRRLAQALISEYSPDGASGPARVFTLGDVLALPKDKAKDKERLIRNTWMRVRSLGPRVHPLFRPVTDAHRQLLEDIMGGKTRDLNQRLAALDAERGSLAARLDAIDDYLNWWEVTRGQGAAADLDRYRKAMKPRPHVGRPEDPIGRYLDETARLLDKP